MKKKDQSDLKSISVTFLVSPKEFQIIREAREGDNKFDTSMSSYIRDLVICECERQNRLKISNLVLPCRI